MSLESKFGCFFPDRAREQGASLVEAEKVHVYRSGALSAVAEADFHEVTFEVIDKELIVNCCCEMAEDGLLCGHAWGALLICDRFGELRKAAGRGVRKSARSKYAESAKPAVEAPTVRTPHQVDSPHTDAFEIRYIIDWRASCADNQLRIQVCWQQGNGAPRPLQYRIGDALPCPADARLVPALAQGMDPGELLPELMATGRLLMNGKSWSPEPEVGKLSFTFREQAGNRFELRNSLSTVDLRKPCVLIPGHLMLVDRLIALTPNQHYWLEETHFTPPVWGQPALAKLAAKTQLTTDIPSANFPPRFRLRASQTDLVPELYVRTAHFKFRGKEQLHAELSFTYNGIRFREDDKEEKSADFARGLVVTRDFSAESAAQDQLRELGFRFQERGMTEEYGWKLAPALLPGAVEALVLAGWQVRAEGKTYRRPSEKSARVSYKTDWFELEGSVTFGDEELPLPELIALASKGINTVLLGDGSTGILPSEWLQRYTVLTEIGDSDDEVVRLSRGQFLLVESLLREQEGLVCEFDEAALLRFRAVEPADACASFSGELRGYQREGLGWMQQMAELGLGVCLADDMGLGKTVQILALLAALPRDAPPSLIVLPKSLVFNWQAEAARFCPDLRVRCYTGAGRAKALRNLPGVDIILSTYGTVRRDVLVLRELSFSYCILDESQAIKNIDSQSAKAVRLIRAAHRICMTGTPIENSLAEMFSQFEFMNPGLLGRLPAIKDLGKTSGLKAEQFVALRRAMTPFFLRRTKAEVATELPDKTVQVLFCELGDRERERYEELKRHYQKELLEDQDTPGRKPIFQALLRLRQAASHPGLSNPKLLQEHSAKQVLIRERVRELVAEQHKVLVFSQFTSMLAIVQRDLEEAEIDFAYLDGSTKDRDSQVRRFQEDSDCRVFLISLKAGGVGLNLTAADYVFLLDPWWNPAIEAQAIDRSYRIGQRNHVFAYKVIAKDTIEEKVLELQAQKQELAEAVFAGDSAQAIRGLSREDLAYILQS